MRRSLSRCLAIYVFQHLIAICWYKFEWTALFAVSKLSQFAVASAADEVLRLTYAVIITHGHQGVKLMGVVRNS